MTGHIWWLSAIVANIAICYIEFMNRSCVGQSALEILPKTVGPIIVAQVALLFCFRDAPSLMIAWAVFHVGNLLLRPLMTHFFIGEALYPLTYIGMGLALAAGVCIKMAPKLQGVE